MCHLFILLMHTSARFVENSSRSSPCENSKQNWNKGLYWNWNEVFNIFGKKNPALGSKVIRRGQLKLKLLLAANSYGLGWWQQLGYIACWVGVVLESNFCLGKNLKSWIGLVWRQFFWIEDASLWNLKGGGKKLRVTINLSWRVGASWPSCFGRKVVNME